MKKVLLFVSIILLMACSEPHIAGVSPLSTGTEQTLPAELKGMKLYNIDMGSGNYPIRVAVLNGQVIGTGSMYRTGKTNTPSYTVIVNQNGNSKVIQASEIILETNDIIVLRK